MIDSLDCLPCLSRQAVVTARLATSDIAKQHAGVGEALMHLAIIDPDILLPLVTEDIQRTLARHTGVADPYEEIRQRLTQAARALLPALNRTLQEAEAPWQVAVRVAAAGNILESARDPAQASLAMGQAWEAAVRGKLEIDHSEALWTATMEAKNIVFFADNAGEIIWDRLLIELIGTSKITLIVRSAPFLHDALEEDLCLATWFNAPRVVVFGDPASAHTFAAGAHSLDQLFAQADLVVTKGSEWPERVQGRVSPEKLFHLLAPSCRRVAARFGVSIGQLVAAHACIL